MDRRNKRLAVSGVFAIIIGFSVHQSGSGLVVSIGAGLLGGVVYYFVSGFITG